MAHQPNSCSKRPVTWIAHVLAYGRVGTKYVGVLSYYLNYIVPFAYSSTDHIFCYVSM